MSISLFPEITDVDLTEYTSDSAYESYTGIVLDPEDKIFKTIKGQFHDKKDFYEKLMKRGYVVRKVFESKVFDWISEHAKSTLDAYLMFSTAFSKWKGNNLLNNYYTQLLNDIPQLNREKLKGDPNSIGNPNQKEEAVLDEVNEKHTLNGIEEWPKYDITLIPLDHDGKNIKTDGKSLTLYKVPLNDTILKVNDYLRSNPEFIHNIYAEMASGDNQIKENPFFVGDNFADKFLVKVGNKGILRTDTSDSVKGGGKVSWDEGDPYILTRYGVFSWNSLGNQGSLPEVNPQTLQLNKNTDQANEVIANLMKNNKKALLKGAGKEDRTTNDNLDKIKEFDTDLKILQAGRKSNPDKFNAVLEKYGARSQPEAFARVKQAQKEFIDNIEINNTDTAKLNQINDQINIVQNQLKAIEEKPYLDVDEALAIKQRLQTNLNNLFNVKKNMENKIHNKEKNINREPEISSEWRKFISPIGGYRAKFVNGDPNKINQESVKESRCTFKQYIPIVDDMIPAKFVNYNATTSYLNSTVDGIITNPGAISTGGTFMTEQDEHWGWIHEQLNQDLFDGTHLRPEVREALLRIANKFKATLGIGLEPKDIYFTGSGANFNYNDLSDIDLHVVYDFEEIGINAEILIKYFIAKKQVFNNDYTITIKGMPVEVGVENLNEPIVSTAVYSVANDRWLVKPEYVERLLPKPDMKQYYDIVQKIEDVIETRDSKKIGELWDELYKIRKDSLQSEGEYGKGNALFKKLRNLGYLDRLKNAYYSSASEELSLEALKEII